jgi:hypothetical protein
MKKITLPFLLLTLFTLTAHAQTITTPADTPLSLSSDLNLPNNKSILVGGVRFIKLPDANGTNVAIGIGAGSGNTSGTQNLFIGTQAGTRTNANANIMLGYRAGYSNTSGTFNSFIGTQAGQANTTGSSNYFFGTNSGVANTTGSGNYFLGDNTGGGNSSGGFNLYIGVNAGNGAGVNGNNNMALGFESGRGNTGGFNNTFVGFRADAGTGNLVNATAIGNNARVNISNAVVLGDNANVGIGTSSPTVKLHIRSDQSNQSGVRLENLTSTSPATALNQTKFLTVDASGTIVLGSSNSSAREAAQGLWQQRGELIGSAQGTGVVIGTGIDKTPLGYKLYVAEGILTEKVKVAIRTTQDWSDHVFKAGYRLSSLSDVEAHIKRTGHLPGLPSATDVVAEGIDLGQMDAKLLAKIEELTLYTIALEKKNQQQEIRLQKLEKMLKKLVR